MRRYLSLKSILLNNKESFQRSKRELYSKCAISIIHKYNAKLDNPSRYPDNYLKLYYSPILTSLKYYMDNLANRNFLEIGFRTPLFLDYLSLSGANVYGLDSSPFFESDKYKKVSVNKISKSFLDKFSNSFDAIFERITLSKLYENNYYIQYKKPLFKDKIKILINLNRLLKKNGLLILQDDRGSIFSKKDFKKTGFRKIMGEIPLVFIYKKKNLGWNTLSIYRKNDSLHQMAQQHI